MSKKTIKYSVGILLVIFIAYNSVYFKKLDEYRLESSGKSFDAEKYARDFYTKKLHPRLDIAIEIGQLLTELKENPQKTFDKYSHALDIGNIRYFLVRGEGIISSKTDDAVAINLNNDPEKHNIRITTEFIYGNAIRDAAGLIRLDEFTNTTELNSVSESINRIIRKEVLPTFKGSAAPGKTVKFSGAIELNQAHVRLDSIEVVPIQLSILNPK
jgi:predicted lipoprotein